MCVYTKVNGIRYKCFLYTNNDRQMLWWWRPLSAEPDLYATAASTCQLIPYILYWQVENLWASNPMVLMVIKAIERIIWKSGKTSKLQTHRAHGANSIACLSWYWWPCTWKFDIRELSRRVCGSALKDTIRGNCQLRSVSREIVLHQAVRVSMRSFAGYPAASFRWRKSWEQFEEEV